MFSQMYLLMMKMQKTPGNCSAEGCISCLHYAGKRCIYLYHRKGNRSLQCKITPGFILQCLLPEQGFFGFSTCLVQKTPDCCKPHSCAYLCKAADGQSSEGRTCLYRHTTGASPPPQWVQMRPDLKHFQCKTQAGVLNGTVQSIPSCQSNLDSQCSCDIPT